MMETGIRIGNEVSAEGYMPTKTEYVYTKYQKKDDTWTTGYRPVREYDEDGNYKVLPALAKLPRYIRVDKEFILTDDFDHKEIQTYGLTTLLPHHVKINKTILQFVFVGKKAVDQNLCTSDPILLKYASQVSCHNQNTWLGLDYKTLYDFVKTSIGNGFKPKDIRTATVNMIFLANVEDKHILQKAHTTKGAIKKTIKGLIEETAAEIGHTPSACKSAYLSKKMLSTIQEVLLRKMADAKLRGK